MSIEVTPARDLTTLLHDWHQGDGAAFSMLIERVYGELKSIAAVRLAHFGATPTLSSTELLHEALLRIIPGAVEFKERAHFFAALSLNFRALLVDHARARAAHKRGGDLHRVTLTGAAGFAETDIADLLAIEQALTQLERLDPRCGQVVHLSYFAGLEQPEIAQVLGISLATVTRDVRFARAWIAKALQGEAS